MDPLDPSDELYFLISSSSTNNNNSTQILTIPEDNVYLQDPVMDGTTSSSGLPSTSSDHQIVGKGKRRIKLPTTLTSGSASALAKDENKKWMHKEIEKQRRQDMARLCTTFRSLLPIEYIKGKRAISDHVHEGTNYIKHLQNKVEKLQAKKEELTKLLSSNLNHVSLLEIGSSSTSTTTISFPIYVIVHPFNGGIEIKCSYSFKKYVFPLSKVLDLVLKQGLNVVNCTSTKRDDRFIHTIQSEDPHTVMSGIDYTELQKKLTEAISSSSLEETISDNPQLLIS